MELSVRLRKNKSYRRLSANKRQNPQLWVLGFGSVEASEEARSVSQGAAYEGLQNLAVLIQALLQPKFALLLSVWRQGD